MPMDDAPINGQDILREVLAENKGLAKTHNLEDTQIIFATPERVEAAAKAMQAEGYRGGPGHLEYWPKDETGVPGYAHPAPGKIALEIFNPDMMKDPKALKQAVYGDLIHGMKTDPTYNNMREEFKKNYTPEEKARIANKKSWWADANGSAANDTATHDAYIRGYLNEPDVAMRGHKEAGGTMYSPQQMQILNKMQHYIKAGELPNERVMVPIQTQSVPAPVRKPLEVMAP